MKKTKRDGGIHDLMTALDRGSRYKDINRLSMLVGVPRHKTRGLLTYARRTGRLVCTTKKGRRYYYTSRPTPSDCLSNGKSIATLLYGVARNGNPILQKGMQLIPNKMQQILLEMNAKVNNELNGVINLNSDTKLLEHKED